MLRAASTGRRHDRRSDSRPVHQLHSPYTAVEDKVVDLCR